MTTAWLTFTPADVPWSIVTCVNHRLGSCPMTRADTGRLSASPCCVVERDLVAELGLLVQLGLQLDVLRAQRVAVLAHVLELALGVEGVAGPAEEVAHGLERLARALLDRRDDVEHAALDGVQAAAGGLAEVGGQEDQGAGYEQSEDYPPPADRLVVHAERFSKALMGLRAAGR